MPPLRRLNDAQLHALPLSELLEHVRRARTAGDGEQEKLAQDILAFREYERVLARVRLRCRRAPEWAHEEIAAAVFESALRQTWRGEGERSFRAWVNAMIDGKVADFFRTKKGRETLRQDSLDAGSEEGDRLERLDPGGEELLDGLERTLQLDCAARALDDLRGRNETHARAIELALFEDLPSRDVAEECGLTPANVDKIKQRFRDEVRGHAERA